MNELSNYEEEKLLQIAVILRRLGIYRNHKGYNRLGYAVYLVSENGSRLEAVVKEVYMPVAEKFHCSWGAVERCLRQTIYKIWISNYDELCMLANNKLKRPPTPAELLDIFAVYMTTI